MAGDERRAEVEAVARAVWNVVGDRMDSWYAPERFREAIAEAAIASLNRLRDARGDDDPTPVVTPEQVERANEMGRGGGAMRRRAARSPQGEDHEAGIEHRHHFNCKASMTGRNDDCDCTPEVWVRVSPSRDGMVAVEDVERLVEATRRLIDSTEGQFRCFCCGESLTMDAPQRGHAPECDYERLRAEFARSATGEQTDHGGDQ